MKRYVVAGALMFLVVLVVSFPARVAYRWIPLPDVTLTGISGSIWNGRADEALAGGAYLRNLSWSFRPAKLLSGQLAFHTSSNPASGALATDVAIAPGGELTLSGMTGNLPLELVHPSFQADGLKGDIRLDFDDVRVRSGWITSIDGAVSVTNLYVPALSAAPLGDYLATFGMEGPAINATVDDTAGVIDVDGVITIRPDRSYSFSGDVAARPDAPPSIEQQLRYLGSPDVRGMRPFRIEGVL